MGKQLAFRFHGGKRKNAGRINRSGFRAHTRRPRVDFRKPLHITIKTTPNLRQPAIFKRMKHACKRAQKFGLHVIQFAILGDHVHLIVEAKNNDALTSGMKSLTGTLARRFKKRTKGRYHLQLITTPTQMRNAYRYVLLNYCKHAKRAPHVDPYSSGSTFSGWPKLARLTPETTLESGADYGLAAPRSWLAASGWRRAA